MGMCTEHPSVGMLSPFQPIGICIEPQDILGMLRLQSMCIEQPKTINSAVSHLFPQTWRSPAVGWMKASLQHNKSSVQRINCLLSNIIYNIITWYQRLMKDLSRFFSCSKNSSTQSGWNLKRRNGIPCIVSPSWRVIWHILTAY